MSANVMEKIAMRGCHLKGIAVMPFLFMMAIDAVNRKEERVRMPKYIINGFPKMR